MGFDCTLHLIDEQAIATELVPRLLGKTKKKLAAFEKSKRAAELLDGAREALRTASPDDAARALTELAIQFSAASLPHLAVRGMALSLWQHAPKKVRSRSPLGLGESPEPLFRDVVARRKELRGRFPTCFEENWMTGVFIPAKRIAAARAWMEQNLASLTPGERLVIEPIERALAAAQKYGLAYWEATDLEVRQARAELLAEAPPDVAGRWRIAGGPRDLVARVDEVVLARGGARALVAIDLARIPPKATRHAVDYLTFAAKRGNDWLLVECRQDQRSFRFRLFVRSKSLDAKPVDAAPDLAIRAISDVALVGGTLFGHDDDADPPRLLRHERKTFVPVAGVPPARGVPNKTFGPQRTFGIAKTTDGSEVLIWDGDGWELTSGKWKKTFALGARATNEWSSVPAGPTSFHYLSNRQIFLAERGKKPKRVASKLTNVMRISAGPDGSLLLRMGDNKRAWAVAAWRSDGAIAGLAEKDVLGRDASVLAIEWSESAGAIFAIGERAVVALARSRLGL